MFSTPVKLGEATVDSKGTIDTVVRVPKDAPTGGHRVVIETKPEDGEPVTFTLGFRVREWTKESRIATWLIAVRIVLAVLAAMFLPPALRRRRRAVV